MCRVLYRLLVLLARLAVRSGRSKDLVIIVLRHQLVVLHRQNSRPALADEDTHRQEPRTRNHDPALPLVRRRCYYCLVRRRCYY